MLEILNDTEVRLLREGARPVPYGQAPGKQSQDLRAERNARWAWAKAAADPRVV